MALPTPRLDDRHFQDLVDDAKRHVQRRCPEWTDHNVSDPGVTLIETFAYMTDQLLYRLNRVPDRLYVKFLELIGLRLLAPTAARAPVTFWLSTPAESAFTIGRGTVVATPRVEHEEPVMFSTVDDLPIVPCTLAGLATHGAAQAAAGEDAVDRSQQVEFERPVAAFAETPAVGDTLLVALDVAVPSCAVRQDFDGQAEGVGVNPKHPPLVWEASTATGWAPCDLDRDETGGLNRSGAIVLHVPAEHAVAVVAGRVAGWLRARVVEPEPGQPPYRDSPVVRGFAACTIGGTAVAVNAETVDVEVLGESEGVAGQRFPLGNSPVLGGLDAPVVEIGTLDGWQRWEQVEHFAESGQDDRHFVLDAVGGEVVFGPAVREQDGSIRRYGAVPAAQSVVRIRRYTFGGGSRGNVAAGALRTLRSSIPFVTGVTNREPANGGVDGESLDEAKARGPLLLRARSRAVCAEDYEVLAREAAPEVARVRCVPATSVEASGSVRVLVVPAAATDAGRIRLEDLVPSEETLSRIAARLDEVRVAGTRVHIEPPRYVGITVVARLIARPRVEVERVRDDALHALYRLLNPLPGGGPSGDGWPFGRPVQPGELFAALQQVRGVELVEDLRIFGANPVTGVRGGEVKRLDLDPHSLVFSFEHHVRVEEH